MAKKTQKRGDSKAKPKAKGKTKDNAKQEQVSKQPKDQAPQVKLNKNVLIKIENLTKQFRDHVVLKNIDLEIMKGEVFGLIGMSGSGKTTLLNLLIGFYQPETGKIYFNDDKAVIDAVRSPKLIHRRCGFAPQEPSFYPQLTAIENLVHFGALYSIHKEIVMANVQDLLKMTKLEYAKDVFAKELSFGMQKRLGIICGLVHKPDVLMLDEPTADLDPILRDDILNLILKIKEQGITVIIASHFLDDMEEICDRVGIIKDGKIIKSASVDEIRKSLSFKKEVILRTSSRRYDVFIKKLRSNRSLKINKIVSLNSHIKIESQAPEKIIPYIIRLNNRIKDDIIELKISKPNLTELFRMIEK